MEDELGAHVSRWAADESVREVARVRSGARQLADQAAEAAQFAEVLRGLADTGRAVRLITSNGRTHVGRLDGVGHDFVSIGTARAWGLVALTALGAIGTEPVDAPERGIDPDAGFGRPGTQWQRGPDWTGFAPVRLRDALERLAGQDRMVRFETHGVGTETVGELSTAGPDYLGVRVRSGADIRTVYVRLEALAELWVFRGSG